MVTPNGYAKVTAPIAALCLTLTACGADKHAPDWDDSLPVFTTGQTSGYVYFADDIFEKLPIVFPPIETAVITYTPEEPPIATTTGTYGDPVTVFSTAPDPDAYYTETSPFYAATEQTDISTETTAAEIIIAPDTPAAETAAEKAPLSERPYSYRFLSPQLRRIYDAIADAAANHESEIILSGVDDADYKSVYELICTEDDGIFFLGRKISYSFNENGDKVFQLQYVYPKEEINAMKRATEAAADRILLKVNGDMSDYDKVKLFFDELALNCEYDASEENINKSDVYGALVNKRAACGGISKAFSYLCRKAGIETLLVTGEYREPHMWNMVKIGSEWYHIDVTAGIPNNSSVRYVRYGFFCVTEEFVRRSRTIDPKDYGYPPAVYDTYNYYKLNDLLAYRYEDVERILAGSVVEAAKNREPVVQFAFAARELFNEASRKLVDEKEALNILDAAYPSAEHKFNRSSVIYSQDSQALIMIIFLTYTD
jgi:hypothetical protein